ncbi:hypothetical protein HYC85_016363 [Camellia sinensis]|uniref:NADP-dependent oxidoreductase domain-containing protein n=1 Tax=Camellia sinensis TaxID=4442 RepID=A0A7J7H0V6_CAMSI|nr:hypothetical protein HYC85_016363 [Camellia sinensis]
MTQRALKDLPQEKVQLATKFGIVKMEPTQVVVKGTVEYVRSCCEASLKRLGVDYIDLYYVHRIDTSVPIQETMGELKKLVEEGMTKIKNLDENIGALRVKLTEDDLKVISDAVPILEIAGPRIYIKVLN